ncbi:hypothetical protein ABZY03_28310 [Streptomyces klenkii]|uniref:hypothetical protein n=1 Tax=Streptomyces klenkii TaxID=1420899 RepID=UPI0033B495EE
MVRNVRHGRFERTLSLLTAAGSLVTAAEIHLEHDRAGFGNRVMWWPVLLGPVGAAAGVAGFAGERMAKTACRRPRRPVRPCAGAGAGGPHAVREGPEAGCSPPGVSPAPPGLPGDRSPALTGGHPR